MYFILHGCNHVHEYKYIKHSYLTAYHLATPILRGGHHVRSWYAIAAFYPYLHLRTTYVQTLHCVFKMCGMYLSQWGLLGWVILVWSLVLLLYFCSGNNNNNNRISPESAKEKSTHLTQKTVITLALIFLYPGWYCHLVVWLGWPSLMCGFVWENVMHLKIFWCLRMWLYQFFHGFVLLLIIVVTNKIQQDWSRMAQYIVQVSEHYCRLTYFIFL